MTTGCPYPPLRFLDVEIDAANGRLVRGGKEQHLRQKAFEVLLYLIEHRDRTVSKEEILDQVWNSAAVSEDTLVQCVVDIRRALGDEAREPRFVRTVLKRGYHFIAPAHVPSVSTSTVTVDVETSHSVEIELVEEDNRSAPQSDSRWRSNAFLGLAAVAVFFLGGITYSTVRAREQPRPAVPRVPSGSLTSDAEALRLYTIGVARGEAHHQAEAVELLQKAIAIDPEFAMAHARIGYVYGIAGSDIAAARPHIARALQLGHRLNPKEKLVVEAWQAITNADYTTAIERYRLIVDRYPTDVEALRRLASLLNGEEQIEEAIALLERARAIDPNDPNIDNKLGIYSLIGRHEESIAARRRYVKALPLEPNAWDSLGNSLHWAGEHQEALDAYDRALELRPDFHLARFHRAATFVQLGRFREAVRDIHECCLNHAGTDQEKGRAWATLADIYRLARDDARARFAASQIPGASTWRPSLVEVQQGLGADAFVPERTRMANSQGSRMERRPEFNLRGFMALHEGNHEKAIEHFKTALRFRPQHWYVDSWETGLGDAYLRLGRYADAAREYERIVAMNPRYSFALYGLARAYEGMAKRAEARGAYERFLVVWKDADDDARDLIDARENLARMSQ